MSNDNERIAYATKDDLFAEELDITTVELPGKKPIRVRGLTADEETRIGKLATDEAKKHDINALIVALCVVDENGARLFDTNETEKIKKLPGKLVRTIVDAAMKISGLDEESRKALGKASGGAGAAGSSSVSH